MLSIATKTTAFANRISAGIAVFARYSSYLGHLAPNDGAVVSYKRLGRGPASGKGKTSGRGQKGQKARSKVPRWLEGGQTPYYKRFPIIGFKRPHRKIYHPLNLDRVQDFWNNNRIPLQEGETLTIRTMRECGLITGTLKDGVKVLGNGKEEYTVPLNIEASRASLGAIRAIENLNKKFSAIYHTKLSLKAHINPDEFLLKKGYVPLHPRPTHRRDIEYYSNPEKRGYLLDNRALLLDHMVNSSAVRKAARKSHISKSLEAASEKKHPDFVEKTTVSLADL